MLSSLLDQTVRPVVDVASYEGNGSPSTEDTCRFFNRLGLDVRYREYRDLFAFGQRGLVRSTQVADCDTDWMLFADCDMVYHSEFFERLCGILPTLPKDAVVCAGRYSCGNNDIQAIDNVVDESVNDRPAYVSLAYKRMEKLTPARRACCGAGFFQLAHADATAGYYVDGRHDSEWIDGRYSKMKSDMHFRKRVGKRFNTPKWFWQAQRHVNHLRDNMIGYHVETQR